MSSEEIVLPVVKDATLDADEFTHGIFVPETTINTLMDRWDECGRDTERRGWSSRELDSEPITLSVCDFEHDSFISTEYWFPFDDEGEIFDLTDFPFTDQQGITY